MSSYRLLRSNKETGPYSQEEMIAMGFKPYDLIWVEGKSAGWRYPSEIPELKDYAPVVEEQPYDRFYKKPVVPARGTPLPQNVVTTAYEPEPAVVARPETVRPSFSPATASVGRHIHVILPSGNTLNVTTMPGRSMAAAEKSVQPVTEEKKPSFSEAISQAAFIPVTETLQGLRAREVPMQEPAAAGDTHYYPAPAAASTAGFSWSTITGLVIGIATLVGLGVMIGLSINRGKPELARVPENNNIVRPKPAATSPAAGPTAENTLITNTPSVVTSQATGKPAETTPPASPKQDAVASAKKDAGASHPKTGLAAKKEAKPVLVDKPVQKAGPENTSVAKEPVIVRPKPAEIIPAASLEKQVNIHNNGYKVGAFGGIYDLQCTLVNDSKYALETVEVEVQYIQANEKVFKTERLSFHDVGAGAQMTMPAPKSPRGIKIVSRIVKINSREPGLAAITVKS